MAKAAYPNKSNYYDDDLMLEVYHAALKDMDPRMVLENFNEHIKKSSFFPTASDLINDKSKNKIEGRYIPNAQETYLEMQRIEQEKYLALTTSVEKVEKAQILVAKEKALRTIAEQVKRSEEENPYKVVYENELVD